MDNTNNKAPLLGLRMLISGLLIFAGALLYMPQSGLVRTLPLLAVLAAVGNAVYNNMKYTAGCAFVFSFCLLSVNGSTLKASAVFSLLGALFALGGAYGLRLLSAGTKTKNALLRKKCTVRGIAVLVITFVVYMMVCGNIIGAFFARAENHKYVMCLGESYIDELAVHHTSFDAVEREYKTYVTFTHDGERVGDKDDCFVSKTQDKITDYYKQLLLEDGKRSIKSTVSSAVDMFEITNCGIALEKGTPVVTEKGYEEYAKDAWYVLSLYHMVDSKEDFTKLYDDCVKELENSVFKEIVVCGGNASEVLYMATLSRNEEGVLSVGEVLDFDEKYVENYGVTEKTVLDYWYNR